LLFTDLKGSTSLYEAIGDAPAYKLVRDHFVYLTDVVEAHRGSLIKTMGDAIMAAFSDGGNAVTAAIRVQSGVADFNRGRDDGGVVLKIGLHQGACIAVTADGKLDYFGSMVNLAARLQGESQGGDIVLSTDLAGAVDLADLMPEAQRFEMARESGSLRGFDNPVDY
jgi:class 3 adenylate cyclase